jgi:hypothetical protein
VTVFDRGEVDGRPYLILEFIDGTSLREVMRNGPVPAAEALQIVSSVLSALEHAHNQGVIHRDIKPENVLLSKGTVVKVADFGLSRLIDPEKETRLTRTHLTLGTFEYMAPEQREKARDADERSDLYATGVVLYELLTGELPIGRFALPSHKRPAECDRRIDAVIERSLEKDPAQRYQGAGEMASAVSAILDRPHADEGPSPQPHAQTHASTAEFQPVKFEHQIDNIATVDHALGTVCYVIAVVSLFSDFTDLWWLFFIFGWYLRDVAEGLRRFKPAARTSQAVISLLWCFTGILFPLGLYAFRVLFGHKGRTYYEARGRGMNEVQAARHTYRIFETAFPEVQRTYTATPAGTVQVEPRTPTPSQIPVQSQVISARVAPPPVRKHRARAVSVGWWCFIGGLVALVFADNVRVLVPVFVVSAVFFAIGFFQAAFSARVTGAFGALFGLAMLAFFGFWVLAPVEAPQARVWATTGDAGRAAYWTVEAADFRRPLKADVWGRALDAKRIAWIKETAKPQGNFPGELRLYQAPGRLKATIEIPQGMFVNNRHRERIVFAVMKALESVASGRIRILVPVDQEFEQQVLLNPPPE